MREEEGKGVIRQKSMTAERRETKRGKADGCGKPAQVVTTDWEEGEGGTG